MLTAYEHVHRVVARDRFGIVDMCHVQLRCLSSSAAQNIATPCPQGLSQAPSWWTSERKTKTICAVPFRSDGPFYPKQRPSLGLHAADAEASELSDAATRSGSTPMAAGSTPGSSTNAWPAKRHGTVRSSNAGMFATSIPQPSQHCSPTIRIGFGRKPSISRPSGPSRSVWTNLPNSTSQKRFGRKHLIGRGWKSN